jgi:hypothetical protein
MWHITVMLRVCFWSEQHHRHKVTFANLALKKWHYVLYVNLLILSELHFFGFSHFSTLCRNSNGHLDLCTL